MTQLQKPFILHMVELSSNAGLTIKYNLTVVEQTNHSISNIAQALNVLIYPSLSNTLKHLDSNYQPATNPVS